ncbi:Homeobox protein HOX1A [Hordeum vulgare]|nr:Homeobox protein HOX1A [Hordeum vulgare]
MADCKKWLLLVVGLTSIVSSSEAYVFYAGGRDGWVVDPAESYNHWAERNRFQINDTIVFVRGEGEGEGADSVLLVTEPDFDACNTRNPVRRLEDAGGRSEFRFDRSGAFFFISSDEDRCQKGKKLYIVVMAARPRESALAPAPGSSPLWASSPGSSPLWASSPEYAEAPGMSLENKKVGNDSSSPPTKGKRGRKGSQITASKKYLRRSAHSSARVLRSTSKDKSKTPNEPEVFPESTSNGLEQIGASDLPSDDSEEDYDPTLAERGMEDGNKSSAEDVDEGSDSDDLDFITSSDESEPSKKKKSESNNKNTVNDLELPSDDSEDDDFDPEGRNSSEDQKAKTNSDESDFTSDSDDFCAEISKSCGKDEVLAPSFADPTAGVDIMEAELEQDSVLPSSSRRQVGRLNYKKLYDEAYGKETTDSSDEEEWSGHSTCPNGNPEDSDTDSLAGSLKPAKTRRARGGRQNNERTPQSERHSGSVSEQHPEVLHSNGTSSTARKKRYGPIVNQKLKAYFEKEPYPSRPAKESLAQELGLTFHQVTRWFSSTRHYSRATGAKKGKRPENYTAENNDGIAADSIQQREPSGSVLEKPTVGRNGIVSEERMTQNNLDEGEKDINGEQTLDMTPTANKHNTTKNSRDVDSPIGAPGGNQQSGTSRNAEDIQDIGCEQTVATVNQNCTINSNNVGSPKDVSGGNHRLNSPKIVGSPRRRSAGKNIPGLEHVDEARRKAILQELRRMKAAGR